MKLPTPEVAPPATDPSGYRKRRSWLEIQSQPRMMSKLGPRSRGDMSMVSRRLSPGPRARCTRTGGERVRTTSGVAMLTAVGPSVEPVGKPSPEARLVQTKQCVAPVSSITETRRGPDVVQMDPETIGLKGGSVRRQGVYMPCWTRRARARPSMESWTRSAATAWVRAAKASLADVSGGETKWKPRGKKGTPPNPDHEGQLAGSPVPKPATSPLAAELTPAAAGRTPLPAAGPQTPAAGCNPPSAAGPQTPAAAGIPPPAAGPQTPAAAGCNPPPTTGPQTPAVAGGSPPPAAGPQTPAVAGGTALPAAGPPTPAAAGGDPPPAVSASLPAAAGETPPPLQPQAHPWVAVDLCPPAAATSQVDAVVAT